MLLSLDATVINKEQELDICAKATLDDNDISDDAHKLQAQVGGLAKLAAKTTVKEEPERVSAGHDDIDAAYSDENASQENERADKRDESLMPSVIEPGPVGDSKELSSDVTTVSATDASPTQSVQVAASSEESSGVRRNLLSMTAEERAAYVAEQKRLARERGRWKAQQMEAQRRFGLRSGSRPVLNPAEPGGAAAAQGNAQEEGGAGAGTTSLPLQVLGRGGGSLKDGEALVHKPVTSSLGQAVSPNRRNVAVEDAGSVTTDKIEAARRAQEQRDQDRRAMEEREQQRLASEKAERERRAADERAKEMARLQALREAQAQVEAERSRKAAAAEEALRVAEARRLAAEDEERRRLDAEVGEGDRLYREAQAALEAARFSAATSLADAADAAYERGGMGEEAREVRLLGLRQSIKRRERAERERQDAAAAARRRAEDERLRLEEEALQAREAARKEEARRQAEVLLWEGCRQGREDAVGGLLGQEPPVIGDVDVRDGAGNTPLLVACREGHAGVGRLLLAHGAAVTATNRDGMGVLHMAFGHGNDELVRFLLGRGADPAAVNRAGQDYRAWVAAVAGPPPDRQGPAAAGPVGEAGRAAAGPEGGAGSALDEIKRQLFKVWAMEQVGRAGTGS